MTSPRDGGPKRCPECGEEIPVRDPLVGWWLCDDCEVAIDDDGKRMM